MPLGAAGRRNSEKNLEGGKMENGQRSGPGGRDDLRVRIITMAAVAVLLAGAMLLWLVVGIQGFWPGMLAVPVAIIVAFVLGRLIGTLLFRPPSGGPPDHPPHA
jgi:hypothetical protein